MLRFLTGFLTAVVVITGITHLEWWPRPVLGLLVGRPVAVVLGGSRIVVRPGSLVGVQVDRVVRDIAWTGSRWDARVPPDRAPQAPEDPVPYMEGALVGQMVRHGGVRVLPLTPGTAALNRTDSVWYAPDAEGRPRFALDASAADGPSARRLREDRVEIPDTHGFSSIAAPAARARPVLAVASMDTGSDVDAALDLASRGIHVYAPADRPAHRLIGYRSRLPRAATIIGSAPVRAGPGHTVVIGGQPVHITLGETVVAQWTDRAAPWHFSDTPWRYCSELVARLFVDLRLVRVRADAGQVDRVIAEARARGATVVAVRVGKVTSMDEAARDASILAAWLEEHPSHRAVLLHTALYEPGYELFFKFPQQTTFGDLDPILRTAVVP